jgi:predicted SnoaL-like aldol condensation-catalyzing enzyme
MADCEANKRLVARFYELFYNQKNFEEGGKLLDAQVINRHAGAIDEGRRQMVESVSRRMREAPDLHIEVTRTAAEGDCVWTHSLISGLPGGQGALSVDIWRVVEGKLAEHWDVRQPIEPGQDVAELM